MAQIHGDALIHEQEVFGPEVNIWCKKKYIKQAMCVNYLAERVKKYMSYSTNLWKNMMFLMYRIRQSFANFSVIMTEEPLFLSQADIVWSVFQDISL